MNNRVYISATNQHVGKTTTTLGLVQTLQSLNIDTGYCKPVGQKYVIARNGQVDKDAVLFAKVMGFDLEPNIHSPVILSGSTVTDYIENPSQFTFPQKIEKASRILCQRHKFVVYEGTGHPGVGSVVDLSNAQVAKNLNSGVIMVVEAGIGSTLDRLTMCLAVFEQKQVPIIGVIVNKTLEQKYEKVKYFVGKKLSQKGIPLLGVIPYEEELALPLMQSVVESINGKVLFNREKLDNRVQEIIAGSLIDKKVLKNTSNLLLVVSQSRLDDALKKLKEVSMVMGTGETILAGIVISGKGELSESATEYVNTFGIPVVSSPMDTYECVIKISRIEVKINTRTPWKVTKAVALFKKYIDVDLLTNRLEFLYG
ncbi:MAG: AAA family ATPase [Bacteroidota bacterium]